MAFKSQREVFIVLLVLIIGTLNFVHCNSETIASGDFSDPHELKEEILSSSSEEAEIQALKNYIHKLIKEENLNDYESDENSALRLKKSIFLPRIGSSKRSENLYPKILTQKKNIYMPRLGRNLAEITGDFNENEYKEKRANKRAIHMLRIGK